MLSDSVPMTAVIRLIVQWARNPNLHQVKPGRQRRKFLKAIDPNTAYLGLTIRLSKRAMPYDLYRAWFFTGATLNNLAFAAAGCEAHTPEPPEARYPGFGCGIIVCESCGSRAAHHHQ